MRMPNTVKQAVVAVWITIAVGAVIAVINKRMSIHGRLSHISLERGGSTG
jgi:hypothetical protein